MRIHTHTCKNILQLEDDDIRVIKKYGYRRDNSFIEPSVKDLEQLRDNNKIVPGLCRELLQWAHYTHAYRHTKDKTLVLDVDTYTSEDFADLEISHYRFYAIPLTTVPSSSSTTGKKRGSINPINVAAQEVQTTNFLKYTELNLTDKDSILIFYRDLYNQGKQYNICVTDSKDITDVPNTTIPTDLSQDVIIFTDNMLYQKKS